MERVQDVEEDDGDIRGVEAAWWLLNTSLVENKVSRTMAKEVACCRTTT